MLDIALSLVQLSLTAGSWEEQSVACEIKSLLLINHGTLVGVNKSMLIQPTNSIHNGRTREENRMAVEAM